MTDHALGEQTGKRLIRRLGQRIAALAQGAGEETGIEQVQNRVLDTADILIDRHPVFGCFLRDRLGLVARIAIAQEVP